MKIRSNHSKKAYLSALKGRMESHFYFGAERCTGFFLGSLFSVTHHSAWEWNRRVTNQKNTAIGWVSSAQEECEVRYFIIKGRLAPHIFITDAAIVTTFVGIFLRIRGMLSREIAPFVLFVCLGMTLAMSAINAWNEWLTEESHRGGKTLKSILLDPNDPFAFLNHQNEL